jgi:ATP-binding cassette ChvD family protein
VLKDIGLCFFPGAKIGIVGENGSGKSTVLRIMAGRDDDYQGKADLSPGYRVGIVMQDPQLDTAITVRRTLEQAFAEPMRLMNEYNAVAERMAEPLSDEEMQKAMDRMEKLQEKLDACDAWSLDQKLNVASDALCLPDDDRVVSTLSGGEKRRVALCKALLEQPHLLLLDEPTNHLDAETVDWLEMQLREYPGTVIIVTHDRYFLDNITRWILELDNGRGIPYEGNYSSWLEQKLAKLAQGERKETSHGRALARELAWIRMSNKERHELSRKRLIEYEQLIAKEKDSEKEDSAVIQIAPGPELGNQVVEFRNVSKQLDNKLLFADLTFSLPRSAIVGVIGPNGTGKTTLFRMITGQMKPDKGEVVVGQTVKVAYADQEREFQEEARPLIEEIGGGSDAIMLGKREIPIRQYLSRFGFKGSDQQKNVGQLSGGERNRAHLAKILKVGGNLLLLDEPTNDLDVNTLRMLEEAVMGFGGSVMVISHDRFFLNRICTHVLVFEGEGKVRFYEGNYQEYEEWHVKQTGSKPFENRRKRYRKLVKD